MSDGKYYKFSDDFDELRNGADNVSKAKAGLKIVGKGFFNVGKFTVTEFIPALVKRAEEKKGK